MVLVAAIAVAAGQVESAATVRLTTEINAHWRGAYDILVRPKDAQLALEQTGGLVEPSFVALAGHGGITPGQVAAIGALPGVEIAAPIGWVGLVTASTTRPSIEVTEFPSRPTLYSVTLTVSTSDGVQDHLVYRDQRRVLLGPAHGTDAPTAISDAGDTVSGPLPGGGWVADIGTTLFPPQLQSPILAVDPEAERALLGDQGAFLDPLVNLKNRDSLTVGTTDPRIVLPNYDQGGEIAILQQHGGTPLNRPVFPIVVSDKTYALVKITIEVSQVGRPLDGLPEDVDPVAAIDAAAQTAGPGLTPVGSNTIDAASLMRPFRANGIGVAWPGTKLAETSVPVQVLDPTLFAARLAKRPTYGPVAALDGGSAPAFRIAALGTVPPGGPGSAESTPRPRPGVSEQAEVGLEQSYRALEEVLVPVAANFTSRGMLDRPYLLAPVGEYDLNALKLPHDPLDYVPYGAYDPPDTTLVAAPDGSPLAPRAMSPTLNPAGLLAVPPMGIVDLHAAELLRGPAPIDAVRIRVAGITDYGPAALAKVEQVAASIAAMGLDVTVVAASSPQAVDIYVPAYDASVSPATDLGWIRQPWTTLGATPRVERGLGQTNLALLLLAIFGVAVVIASSELLDATVRKREAAVLAAVGWRRVQILRWRTAESLVAGLIAIALGFGAWLLAGREAVGLVVAVIAGVLFPGFGLAAALTVRPTGRPVDEAVFSRPLGPEVSGLLTYAWRSLLGRPWRSVTTIVGLALSAGVIAPAAILFVTLETRVGPTGLASALSGRMQPYQLVLLGLIAIAALTCAFLGFRIDLRARTAEFRVLEGCGWRPTEISRMLSWTRLSMALPAALLGAAVGALLAGPLAGADAPLAAVAGLAGCLAFLTTLVWSKLAEIRVVPL